MILRPLVATIAILLAMPALPALAAWPPEVAAADRALIAAKSFRVTTTEGPRVSTVVVQGADRDRIVLPPNAVAIRDNDESDGVGPAHLYHIIYPGGAPQVRWYIRVSDGLVHTIRRPGRGVVMTLAIDQYKGLKPAR
jgi:hypothetical protein